VGDKPAATCARDDYVYFRLDVVVSVLDDARARISNCTLTILGDEQSWAETYSLPSTDGHGCSLGLTPIQLGALSYSCCNQRDAPLGTRHDRDFRVVAVDSAGSAVARGDLYYSDCTRPDGGFEIRHELFVDD
jgi:hypothetical protein